MGTPIGLKKLLLGAAVALIASTGSVAADPTVPPETPPATTPATPPAPTSDNAAQNIEQKKAGEEIICKTTPPPLGSRVGRRKICRTASEWKVIQAEAKAVTDEMQQQGRGTPPPGGS